MKLNNYIRRNEGGVYIYLYATPIGKYTPQITFTSVNTW